MQFGDLEFLSAIFGFLGHVVIRHTMSELAAFYKFSVQFLGSRRLGKLCLTFGGRLVTTRMLLLFQPGTEFMMHIPY